MASVGLHTSLVAGLLYASIHQFSPPQAVEQPMTVMLTAPAPVSVPAPVPPTVAPTPQPEPVSPPPEPEPQPQPEPEPVSEPPAPVPIPQPKPKPKPVHKEAARPRPSKIKIPAPEQTAPTDNQTSKPAIASAAPPAAPAEHQTGPVVLSRPDPGYPERARALGIEGRVQIEYDVTAAGEVTNLRIISASPRNVFEREIREATRRWRYQSGKPAQNISMTILFKLTGVTSEHH
ncbi:TonB family protein [Martelella alba]|uniref:TonB family protein n=1 Tax=Martelella alba TaxID=2590451 RepID=UPI001E3CF8E8|nr:TonB family protein [Martelella alba]